MDVRVIRGRRTRRAAARCVIASTAILASSCNPGDATPDAALVEDAPPRIDAARPAPDAALGTSTVLRLDGDGDCVDLPRNPEYGLVGTRFTIELWFRPESLLTNDYAELYTRRGNYGEYGLVYSAADDGRVALELYVDGATSNAGLVLLTSRTALSVGAWHHVAGVVDGRDVRLYVDGVLKAEQSASTDITWRPDDPRTLNDAYRTFIGCTRSPDDGGMRFVGRLAGDVDDVRVSRVARYAGPSFVPPATTTPDADTVGLWTFEEADGPTAEDSSPSGALDGTIVGAVRVPGGR